jgi:hypothetical protein
MRPLVKQGDALPQAAQFFTGPTHRCSAERHASVIRLPEECQDAQERALADPSCGQLTGGRPVVSSMGLLSILNPARVLPARIQDIFGLEDWEVRSREGFGHLRGQSNLQLADSGLPGLPSLPSLPSCIARYCTLGREPRATAIRFDGYGYLPLRTGPCWC